MSERDIPPSEIKRRLKSWAYVAMSINNGLDGKPFDWNGGEFDSYKPKAAAMGLTLVTKTAAKKLGYRLRRGAKPVGSGYFGAPISKSADLYVLECQCTKKEAL